MIVRLTTVKDNSEVTDSKFDDAQNVHESWVGFDSIAQARWFSQRLKVTRSSPFTFLVAQLSNPGGFNL